MRVCPNCKSPWVCWNWMDTTSAESLNPHREWLHECHNCSNTFVTNGEVDDGIPYKIVQEIGHLFVEPGRFDRELAESMAAVSDLNGLDEV